MTKLFNSKTEPIPRIRPDLDIIPIQENGDAYLYFHDIRGYATPDFALDRSVGGLLSLLDGRKSVNDLKSYLGNGTTTDQLLKYIQFLDENRLLYSAHFKQFARRYEQNYEDSSVHQSITAGKSYPANPAELNQFLDEAFERYQPENTEIDANNIKALYAPHIDPRVGMEAYVKAFSPLQNTKPKRVVLLATSHYAGMHPDTYTNQPFIVSTKDFEMPQGTVPADRKAIDRLLDSGESTGITGQDRAHRIEHSIELHLLFLQYILQYDFSIIPILVSGFDDLFYMGDGFLSDQIDCFSSLLHRQFGKDDETLFLISGDLAHVGKKFGDDRPAETMKDEVKKFDKQFMQAGRQNTPDEMLQLLKQNYNPYRICGFPPLYTFLKTFPGLKGEILNYQRWDETERESAVTFGSILYHMG